MSLKVKVVCTSDNGESETIHQDYTDSPFLDTAIRRAQEIAKDHYTWGVSADVKWQKVEITVEIDRSN